MAVAAGKVRHGVEASAVPASMVRSAQVLVMLPSTSIFAKAAGYRHCDREEKQVGQPSMEYLVSICYVIVSTEVIAGPAPWDPGTRNSTEQEKPSNL